MPEVAIFSLVMILLLSGLATSYAIETTHLLPDRNTPQINFDSGILQVDSGFFTENNVNRYLVLGTGWQHGDHLPGNPIYHASSDGGFFYVTLMSEQEASDLAAHGYSVIKDFELDFHTDEIVIPDASRIQQITRSDVVAERYGYTGNGTTIAIVDTGIDFSNPDIQHSLARDEITNHPIMIDPDGQGIVLTNATFIAHIDENQIIRNYSKPIPSNATSSVYVTRDGVFLDVSQGGEGSQISIYNSFFPHLGSSIVFNGTLVDDMKIGDNNRDYIQSKSGEYRLGMIYQGALSGPLAKIQVVPVLAVDSFESGVYDTIIPDLSTSWEDYTRDDLESGEEPDYDFDFTDEVPVVLGSGKEFLIYDSNGDGRYDYSAGTVGAQVLDIYGSINGNATNIDDSLQAINGTLLPPLDPDGEFFGLMTDFRGHGTSSAATIVSRGHVEYDIYNDSKKHTISGVAPDAKVIPVKALWFGDAVYGWLWSAGFDSINSEWKFSGTPRVDVISNSWGVSTFPAFNASPGMDVLSLILSALATPQSLDDSYPGVTMVTSAGNSGHGYGTMGLPNAAPFGITVGATTNNVFVGYGPFKDEPRFGNTTEHSNHVVDFSSRGPSIIGDPKPDIMSIGAHGFVPSNVIVPTKNSTGEPISLFGGTSMAAPIVSGSAALLIEGMKNQSITYDPFLIKNILMSTATDLGNDPFTQGSGLADVSRALDFVNAAHGTFIVYNDKSYENIRQILAPAIDNINSTEAGLGQFGLPHRPMPMTGWFAGHLLPGERSTTVFTIENPSDEPISVNIIPQKLALIKKTDLDGMTTVREQDPILNKSDAFAPNYVRLSDVKQHFTVGDFFDDEDPIPIDSELMILNVNFPFDEFMNGTADVYADDLQISSLYLYDWIDHNNDTKVTSGELSMVTRGGSWGTVQELRVSDPGEKFQGTPMVGIYPVPSKYSYWLGEINANATSMNYGLSASYYQKEQWPLIWSEHRSVVVPANGVSTIDVTLVVPKDLRTGVHQGFLSFQGEHHTVNAPVSFASKTPVAQNESVITVDGRYSDDVMYGNGYTKGAFDMVNRYMAGDWRQFYFDIQDEMIDSAAIEISWESDDTNLAAFVMDPTGRIIHTNVPSGVFGHLLDWPSLDWLGNSPFSEGGGFYPVKNKDDTSTVLYVPINQTGTYSIMTHSTLFGGNSTTEPISIVGKFTSISANDTMSLASEPDPDEATEPTPVLPSGMDDASESTISDEPAPAQVQEAQNPAQDNPANTFDVGVVVGVVAGIAIGSVAVLILRQKSR